MTFRDFTASLEAREAAHAQYPDANREHTAHGAVVCEAECRGWSCSRVAGHNGPHAAGMNHGQVAAVWDDGAWPLAPRPQPDGDPGYDDEPWGCA